MTPGWVAGRTWYHLHALRAAGVADANPDVTAGEATDHGLARLLPWLDHVASLGCGGVLLTPVGVSSTHGYDVVDPLRLDQRLGDDGDFDRFVEECHRRDLRLLLDGVFNHVGRGFGPFRDVLERRQASAFADWFRVDFGRDDGDGFGYRDFEGHRELVALNHRSDAVLDWAVDVASHWLARGADGWRLDVAYAIPPEFLRSFSNRVLEHHPDAFLFGEMIHGDYLRFVEASGLHSVTQYELHKALWSACNDGNPFELSWALQRHGEFAAAFPPVTFGGNHDVTRLLSQLRDPAHLRHALVVLFTVPGVPCVYYGDELALRGVKHDGPGGDDAIRPALPPTPDPGEEEAAAALTLHRDLIALRRGNPWLTTGRLRVTDCTNEALSYLVEGDGGTVRVELGFPGEAAVDVVSF